MARAMVLLCACLLILVPAIKVEAQALGVNWGTIAFRQLDPKIVVNMIKDNGLKKVKLFEPQADILKALAGSDLEVMLGIPNLFLQSLSQDYKSAQAWVKENVTSYAGKMGANITYVTVGNEAFLTSYNNSFTNITFPAMKNIFKALNEAGFKDIKVSTPFNGDVYTTTSYKPSDGVFRPDVIDEVTRICQFLKENDAAFIVNIYPFFNLYQNPGFPYEYAFFDNNGSFSLDDNGKKYTNVFDANVDNLLAALKRVQTPDLQIIVGEAGWPTDGYKYATVQNAERFYTGLLKKMNTNQGTPARPNNNPDVYLFSLLDENFKSVDPGMFERHWGIFAFDGQPKFPLDLFGKGDKKMLVGAKNVPYEAKQWCVHNQDGKNQTALPEKVGYACNNADCTTIVPGASCDMGSAHMNASVAFNMYYQMQDQANGACDFQGLAKIVNEDPSNGTCHFPIMIKKYQEDSSSPGGHRKSGGHGNSSSSPSLSVSLRRLLQVVAAICIVLFL